MAKSNIGWTDSVWNPSTGCTEVSSGCKHCYAKPLSKRLMLMGQKKYRNNFKYTEHENELDKPLLWKKPRLIFVNSMSDLFHEDATDSFIDAVFHTMMIADQHIYQILTKRPKRMKQFVDKWLSMRGGIDLIPDHIWLGTSIEDENVLDRLNDLKEIQAKIKFVSFEPLLGKINADLNGISWAIAGGESGRHARPIEADWARSVLKCCRNSGTKFYFKQWGGRYPTANGRKLDGKIYDEFPEVIGRLKLR